VHILVNLVGGGHSPAPILDYPEEVFDEVVHRNMSYVFFASRAVARSMKERGIAGSIVNLTSVSGLSAAKNVSVYGVAKAGVVSLTDTMAVEWGRYGIRANAVAPGGTRTPRNYRLHGSESMDKAAEWNPLSRTPHGSDIAAAVLFLVSDLAKFVTGQVIVVDCGASVRRPHQGGADLPEN
jgi:3-oxoacyl-[acyl-carrier protein] reductase